MLERPCGRQRQNTVPKLVLVGAARCAAALEIPEGGGQEPRLLDELTGPTVVRGTWFQHPERQSLECFDILLVPAQVVVKPEHLCDEARTDSKRRLDAGRDDRATGDAQ